MRAGFSAVEITPPPGTRKIGWLRMARGTRVLDPIFSRAAVFESDGDRIAVIQLDVLSVRRADVAEVRKLVEARYGFPGASIMVTATHNHAGPAVVSLGVVERDEAYTRAMIDKVVTMFGNALDGLEEAELGVGSVAEFSIGHNRRVVMRDGLVKTHGTFESAQALCLEGPVDPELAVIAARRQGGQLLGMLVNYSCHPTHHGDDDAFSAGWPGALAQALKERGCPHLLFINGAQGNISTSDPVRAGASRSMEEVASILAQRVSTVLGQMTWRRAERLSAASATVTLPFREITEETVEGTVRGAQRFIDSAIYDAEMPRLLDTIRKKQTQPAEVQVLLCDEQVLVGIPAELFVELGLEIKERAFPKHALVFGLANGMVGYIPTRAAFERGGYETTFSSWSKLAPQAGEMLVDAAIRLIQEITLLP